MEKQQIKERQQEILSLIKQFCIAKLNEEYYEISERLVNKLGRKRDVPFIGGQTEIWAAAVIHAIGTINFLFDKSSKPYASVDDINDFFKTKKTTSGSKSKLIRDLLKMGVWDKEFSISSMKESNPFNQFVMVNGFMMPISSLPEEYQALVRQARAEGRDISFSSK